MKTEGYNLIVEWSKEDECYIGTCPELFEGGCHGDSEDEVRNELILIASGVIDDLKKAGTLPLPSSRSARTTTALPARARTNLNQEQFAAAIGTSVATIKNWEQKRSSPKGAARTLLRLIELEPKTIHGLRKLHDAATGISDTTVYSKNKTGLKRRTKKASTRHYYKNKAGSKVAATKTARTTTKTTRQTKVKA